MEHNDTIRSMTLQQKISYCTGADMWHTKAIPALGIDAIAVSDGPHGLRCQSARPIFSAPITPSRPPVSRRR